MSTKPLWHALARLESAVLRENIDHLQIQAPVYIAGVARSGSTILLEMLERHPGLTSHRYSDFPYIYTPYWRNWLKRHSRGSGGRVQERAHQDRIRISEESPEAIEEVLWMDLFPHLHGSGVCEVLDEADLNPAFDTLYTEHIRKLLLVRDRQRYLSKGNYNLTRLAYLQRLFPDARFIIPVRHPYNHIASLIKQDRLFTAGLQDNPRARRYLGWVGHFEFGPDKRPVHLGDEAAYQTIVSNWAKGETLHGWALYWNSLYRFALDQLAENPSLRSASTLLRYEDLCRDSATSIDHTLEHCRLGLEGFEQTREYYIDHLSEPAYYRPDFNPQELALIGEICGETASRLGYPL